MANITVLTDRQKAALRPFLREAELLEENGFLDPAAKMKPGAYFPAEQWQALIYAFETLV